MVKKTDRQSGKVSRRSFLQGSAALGTAMLTGCSNGSEEEFVYIKIEQPEEREQIFRGNAGHNCGGRCLLKIHVKDGKITRFLTDDERQDRNLIDPVPGDDPQRRACLRCRGKREWFYRNDRLLYPMKQTGKRGDLTTLKRISWDEAAKEIADKLKEIAARDNGTGGKYIYTQIGSGDGSRVPYAGSVSQTLANAFGGRVSYRYSYSVPSMQHVFYHTIGGSWLAANSRQDLCGKEMEHLLIWSMNVADCVLGTNSMWYITQAKELGKTISFVDVYKHRNIETSLTSDGKCLTPIPGTDPALALAMMHYLVSETVEGFTTGDTTKQLLDFQFINDHIHGFFDNPAPTTYRVMKTAEQDNFNAKIASSCKIVPGASLCSYIFGNSTSETATKVRTYLNGLGSEYGVSPSIYPDYIGYNVNADDELFDKYAPMYGQTEKTPEWAEKITGVKAEDIKALARMIAEKRTTMWISTGMQRNTEGEQAIWIVFTLGFITKCFGALGESIGWPTDRNNPNELWALPYDPDFAGNTETKTEIQKRRFDRKRMTFSADTDGVDNTILTYYDCGLAENTIQVNLWQDFVENGGSGKSRWNEAQVKYGNPIKAIINFAGNSIVNQCGDAQDVARILRDTEGLEIVVSSDFFMTPSMQFSDYLLPAAMYFEKTSLTSWWDCAGETVFNQPKIFKPQGEAISDLEIGRKIAAKAGITLEYDKVPLAAGYNGEDKDRELCRWAYDEYIRPAFNMPYEELELKGILSTSDITKPIGVQWREFRNDPANNPLQTPTGKIEVYSLSMMEDYEGRRNVNFDKVGTTKHGSLKNNGELYTASTAFDEPSYTIGSMPSDASLLNDGAKELENRKSLRFVYPIPMYIPVVQGRHACDSDTSFPAYPTTDATGATRHPDLLGLNSTHPLNLNGYHSYNRSHSMLNNSNYVAEQYKRNKDGKAAWHSGNHASGGAPLSWGKNVYEPVFINPKDAGDIKTGDRVLITSIRGKIYASAVLSFKTRPGVLMMAEGALIAFNEKGILENGIDEGSCLNTLTIQRPTRIGQSMAISGDCRVKIEKA